MYEDLYKKNEVIRIACCTELLLLSLLLRNDDEKELHKLADEMEAIYKRYNEVLKYDNPDIVRREKNICTKLSSTSKSLIHQWFILNKKFDLQE